MNVLQRLRIENEYSIKQLAEISGVSTGTIVRGERGDKISKLSGIKLAKAFGVKLADLAEIVESGATKEEPVSTHQPEPEELADLLEVIARSQKDGPGARVSINQAIEAIKKQNADFLATRNQGQPKQISA